VDKESINVFNWQNYLEENQARFVDELLELLRIPSISTSPEHLDDVRRAAEWTAARLEVAGLEGVRVIPTAGHPVVYGEWLHAPGRPTILIYGHGDVQPPDPLHLWTTPPFEPTIRDGRVFARGASDMKGTLLATIVAVEALLKTEGALPVNVKFLFEGEEEIGAPHLSSVLANHRELFACDMAISADGGQWSETEPNITLSARGGCGLQVDVKGASSDLHSGLYGGAIQNPIHALVRLLDTMHAPDGTITVDGFYDEVRDFSEAERAQIAETPYDEANFLAGLGLTETFGEPGYTTRERIGIRPTLEINGIWGGFQGGGVKTVLPNEAHAKITCRLVADQDPVKIRDLLTRHIESHASPGVTVRVQPAALLMKPYMMPADHPGNEALQIVHEQLYGRKPYYHRNGGSNAVYGLILDHLGVYTVGLGFILDDENIHAPDEFFRLSSFQRAQKAYCMMLKQLAAPAPQ
jgi:acetylornithine deacetylase/succinyl-diaminopimelate desuccinylase-like protein